MFCPWATPFSCKRRLVNLVFNWTHVHLNLGLPPVNLFPLAQYSELSKWGSTFVYIDLNWFEDHYKFITNGSPAIDYQLQTSVLVLFGVKAFPIVTNQRQEPTIAAAEHNQVRSHSNNTWHSWEGEGKLQYYEVTKDKRGREEVWQFSSFLILQLHTFLNNKDLTCLKYLEHLNFVLFIMILGGYSQNFLQKFVKNCVTFGLNILSFLRLKVLILNQISLDVDITYIISSKYLFLIWN